MNCDIHDDDDLHSSSTSSPRHRSRNPIHHEEISLPTRAIPGDIIQLNDGTRKKYNGSSWRRLCSKSNCSHYTQSQGLCKPHLAALKKRQTPKLDRESSPVVQFSSSKQNPPKKGDIVTLVNGIRKKYDGRQYRRICANQTCTTVVHGSLEYQNGFESIVHFSSLFFDFSLCPHHYQESRVKTSSIHSSPEHTSAISLESFISPQKSVMSSTSRKRPRPNSPIQSTQNNKSSTVKSNHRLSIAVIPPSVNIEHPKKGDVIEMTNGSRKKFDGVVWRTICSIPECFIAAQRNELCRKHFVQLNGKPNSAPTMVQSIRTNSLSSIDGTTKKKKKKKKNSYPIIDQETIKVKEESLDYDDQLLSLTIVDQASNASG